MYVFPSVERAGLLADPRHVFHYIIHHHHEAPNKGEYGRLIVT